MKKEIPTITLGRLREELSQWPDDTEISFSGLTWYQPKQRGENLVQIEFNELVYLDEEGRVVVQNPD